MMAISSNIYFFLCNITSLSLSNILVIFDINLQRIADKMDVQIKHWAAGKEGNMRALLSSLQHVSFTTAFLICKSFCLTFSTLLGKKVLHLFSYICYFLYLNCSLVSDQTVVLHLRSENLEPFFEASFWIDDHNYCFWL